jgi:hypothetical protein
MLGKVESSLLKACSEIRWNTNFHRMSSNENGAPMFKTYLNTELLGVPDSAIIKIGLKVRSQDKGMPIGQENSLGATNAYDDGVIEGLHTLTARQGGIIQDSTEIGIV